MRSRQAPVLEPTVEECLSMLSDLEAKLGSESLMAAVIGPSLATVRGWQSRKAMSSASRWLVRLVWTFVFHPERLPTREDLAMCGATVPRRHKSKRLAPPFPRDEQ